MYGWWKDLVFGARTQFKTPAVTLAIIITLGFGIAAINVAFSLLNSFFIRPLPVEEPQRLVRIYSSFASGMQYFTVSYADYADMRELTVFSGVIVEAPVAVSLRASSANERVWGEQVSGDYFSVLGLRPAYGRFFTPEEGAPHGGDPVIVLSYGLWQRRFGGSHRVLDETVLINGQPCRVIGVAPENFRGITLGVRPELWRPASGDANKRGGFGFFAMARLQPGVTLDQAGSALDVLARQLQQSYPGSNRGVRFTVLPEADGRVHPMVRGSILGFSAVLVAMAALLLLLACANVAAVLLVRAASRRREIGVRIALGATRGRIVRQFLIESAALALLAGGVGLALAWMVSKVLSAIHLPTRVPISVDFGLDERVLLFSLVVTVLTGVMFGVTPAFEGSRFDLVTMMKDGVAFGLRGSWLRSALVAVQVGLAMVLLIGGGLFLRSLQNAHRVDIGFDPRGVVMTSVDPGLQGYSLADVRQFWRRVVDRIAELPSAESVSLASTVPFYVDIQQISMGPADYQPPAEGGWPPIDVATVDSGYFRTMGIPLLEGRDFSERDTDASPAVVIVNDVLARRFWRGTGAVGKRLATSSGRKYEVIGVTRRTKHLTLGEDPKPYVYFPWQQDDARAMTVLVRGTGDPASLLREVRDTVHAMDDTLPLYNVTTMSEHVAVAQIPATSGATVLSIIGLVALTLTSLGLYGTMAQTVGRRTYEIGVRRALGAQGRDVVLLVGKQAMVIVVCGLAGGVALGFAGSRLLARFLYGVEATDPLVFSVAPVVLMLVCLVACWMPASQAIRIEPAHALRHDE
jgi:macrolide transport system ATP-binding/permease protein